MCLRLPTVRKWKRVAYSLRSGVQAPAFGMVVGVDAAVRGWGARPQRGHACSWPRSVATPTAGALAVQPATPSPTATQVRRLEDSNRPRPPRPVGRRSSLPPLGRRGRASPITGENWPSGTWEDASARSGSRRRQSPADRRHRARRTPRHRPRLAGGQDRRRTSRRRQAERSSRSGRQLRDPDLPAAHALADRHADIRCSTIQAHRGNHQLVLWPNGSGLPWVRVWLWGGSPERSSKFTTTSSNGRFSLTHGPLSKDS